MALTAQGAPRPARGCAVPISHRPRTHDVRTSFVRETSIAGQVWSRQVCNGFTSGCAMNETFGTKLRLQREEQQIPLAAIAEQTKIKLSLLEGLERDDVSRWPTGIFRRSYFRAYTSAIGLEPDRVLREFQALYPDPHTEDEVTDVLAQARQDSPRRPPTRLRYLIDSAVNALPALHLQPSLRSVLSGIRTEAIPPVETSIDEVAPQPTWRRGTHPTPANPSHPRNPGHARDPCDARDPGDTTRLSRPTPTFRPRSPTGPN